MRSNQDANIAFCLGMHKSGTSWLFEQCFRHPEIHCLQRDRHFFSKASEYDRGFATFVNGLHSDQLNLEMGNHYATDPIAINKILKHYPSARCILILRHPVQRAISHYKQDIKTGTYPISTSLSDAIVQYPNIVEFSQVKSQLGLVRKSIADSNLLILSFDDIHEQPEMLLAKLQSFLELSESFDPSISNQVVNKGRVPRNVKLEQWQNAVFYKMQQSRLGKSIWTTLKKLKVGSIVKKLNTSQAEVEISKEDVAYLEGVLKDEIGFFESFRF